MLDYPIYLYWLIPLMIWDVTWKGIALWKASKNNQKYWFITLLLINSAGILSILYINFFQKGKKKK